jgi:hypothetical protein
VLSSFARLHLSDDSCLRISSPVQPPVFISAKSRERVELLPLDSFGLGSTF